MKDYYKDRLRFELMFGDLFEKYECKTITDVTKMTEFLCECFNNGLYDYCSDEGLDTDERPIIDIE